MKGFNNTTVSVSTEKFSGDRVNLIYYIEENDQSQIERITFNGNQTFSDRYLLSFDELILTYSHSPFFSIS